MFEWQHAMQRCINRGRLRIQIVNAVIEESDHLVLMLDAAIYVFKIEQTIHIQCCQSVALHGTQVATAALDPHHFRLCTRQRIGSHGLAGSISAAVIREPEIGTQEIGTIYQQGDLIALQAGGRLIIPQITDMLERTLRIGHVETFKGKN